MQLVKDCPSLFDNPKEGGYLIVLDKSKIETIYIEKKKALYDRGLPEEWAEIGIVYEDQYLTILRDAVQFPDGRYGTYIRLVDKQGKAPGVAILPIHKGRFVLINHFRHATRKWHLEIPRGFGKKGLSSDENAARELEEEIQAKVSRLIPLGRMYTDTGMTSDCVELFFSEVQTIGEPDAYEAISKIVLLDIKDFEKLTCEGIINDPFAVMAYTRAKLLGLIP